jgi:glycosyltransferase involved in cell wall biosynthesis
MIDFISTPMISVILPAFNGEKTINKSIESILLQDYKNFELIIINDGSTDRTASILNRINDNRIKIITQKNSGLPKALNSGIQLASGKYIARQDQDDVSHASRFSKQVELLEHNSNVIVVGTWARIVDQDGKKMGKHKHPITPYGIKTALLYRNALVHSSVMMRRNVLVEAGLYETSDTRQPPEDYELWCRLVNFGEITNIPQFLVSYLKNPSGLSILRSNQIQLNMCRIVYNNLKHKTMLEEHKLQNFISMLYPTTPFRLKINFMDFKTILRLFIIDKNDKKLKESFEIYREIMYIFLRYFKSRIKTMSL